MKAHIDHRRQKKKARIMAIPAVLFLGLFFLFSPSMQAAGATSNLDAYAKSFYNRYSTHFDTHGLVYASPSYGVKDFTKPRKAREWISLASYYKYRAKEGDEEAKQVVRVAMRTARDEIQKRPSYTVSFHDAEALFLVVRMHESIPDVFTHEEEQELLLFLAEYLEQGVRVKDTENRALIASTHWQYMNDALYQKGMIDAAQKAHVDGLIQKKIDEGIRQSITDEGWYFEGKRKSFSAHYQAISAFMLLLYGDMTQQPSYVKLARRMYTNIKTLSFRNGLVEARIGKRPVGLGVQFYAAMSLLGKYLGDDDYRVYLTYSRGNRFFSDKRHPNRLEFHSTIEGTKQIFHDDYSFSDIVELGLLNPTLRNISIEKKYSFSNPVRKANNKLYSIANDGKVIVVNNKTYFLGSWGNWSHVSENAHKR